MDQRFRCVQEFELEPRNRGVQIEVFAESGGGGVEPRLRPAVLLGHTVGIGEDQVLGDLAERMVAGERRDPLLLPGSRKREVGREKQRARHKGRDVADKARIERAGNQPLAHDDMRLDQLHDDERKPLIVVQHIRHQSGRQPRLMRQRQIFVMRARQRQRPAFADETHVGQRLLDGDAARVPLDDEHEIEVAVADLADRPGSRCAAKPGRDRREPPRGSPAGRPHEESDIRPAGVSIDRCSELIAVCPRAGARGPTHSRFRKFDPISVFVLHRIIIAKRGQRPAFTVRI